MRDLRVAGLDVSRETLQRLEEFSAELKRWSVRINLMAPTPEEIFWERHIVDSAQLYPLRSDGLVWCDLGSGGGLPAMVVAILAKEDAPDLLFHLVESDARKAAFLRITSKALALNVTVHHARAENLAPLNARTVTARALAPLDRLLGYVQRHLVPGGVALLPKGKTHEAEIAAARLRWSFELDLTDSVAERRAKILSIRHIASNAGSK